MTKKIDDGGPAFPCGSVNRMAVGTSDPLFPGMTLRDWFAGLAVCGASADPQSGTMSVRDLADYGYRIADAMLEARKK